MTGFSGMEGYGSRRLNSDAHHRPCVGVDPGRKIDGEDRRRMGVDRLNRRLRAALDRAGEPGSEYRVDDQSGALEEGWGERGDLPFKKVRHQLCVALERRRIAD